MHYDNFGNVYYSNYDPFTPEDDGPPARHADGPEGRRRGQGARPATPGSPSSTRGSSPSSPPSSPSSTSRSTRRTKAFPYIEQLSQTNPRKAKDLAEEFVRVWTKNHDPNSQQLRRSRFFYVYGFENRAEGIPLTRSKQERNLVELAGWVKKLRALPIGEIDEKLLTKAFTACHSTAEVYRLDAIEKVFGSFDALKPMTLAELIQQMRGNLIGVWRQPAEQEKNKTKRREKDIRAEVLRGYEVAQAVIDRGLARHPDHWALVLARATMMHDENNYRQEIERSAEFAPRRQQAFAEFRRAARLYAATVPGLEQNDETTQVFDYWYSAGARRLRPPAHHRGDTHRPPPAQADPRGAPGDHGRGRRAAHEQVRQRACSPGSAQIKPSIKFRYLKAGFEIVGDHPQAYDARKVFDYYKDLVTEIKLETRVDGGDVVGHEKPFGVFVNLRHTREIERESGGFGRYLQNQNNNNNYFYYNFGRPLENYRDKFQDAAKQALTGAFRGHVGHLPGREGQLEGDGRVRLAGDAVCLPPAQGARSQGRQDPAVAAGPRLHGHLGLRGPAGRVADDPGRRRAGQGTGPPVREAPDHPDARRAAGQGRQADPRDQGGRLAGWCPTSTRSSRSTTRASRSRRSTTRASRSRSSTRTAKATVIDSERTWLVSYRAAADQPKPPATFRFASAKVDGAEMTYQRYVDADLAKVGPEVSLEERVRAAALCLALVGRRRPAGARASSAVAIWKLRSGPKRGRRPAVPDARAGHARSRCSASCARSSTITASPRLRSQELAGSIERIERHYFAESDGESDRPAPGRRDLDSPGVVSPCAMSVGQTDPLPVDVHEALLRLSAAAGLTPSKVPSGRTWGWNLRGGRPEARGVQACATSSGDGT